MDFQPRQIDTELAIIGSGLAGAAASVFARNKGISCTLAGNTGALAYTTGHLDLLGFLDSRRIADPWQGLIELDRVAGNHPLAGIDRSTIETAFTEFIDYLQKHGIGYSRPGPKNILAFTPAGTLKPTLCVPQTMAKGVEALQTKASCTILGFRGLKGFSAHQITANLREHWPDLQDRVVSFPGHAHGELYAEAAARSLEVAGNRELLAEIIAKEGGASAFIGIPAILGMHNPDRIHAELERLTGRSIFEIPTMPPSVPGMRLRQLFEQTLPGEGVILIPQQKVDSISFSQHSIELELADNYGPIAIQAQTALLATGRFLSGGLTAHFDHIAESLIKLPVHQPPSRQDWYREEYLDSLGHEIHLAGIEIDSSCRPLGQDRQAYDRRLFGAGSVLAHQDWIRLRCGAGVAIVSAYRAVEAAAQYLRNG
jgi:glycerol-3-phosphate dehydrogenase subunit B